MKKLILSFLALLLGFGLTWAQQEVSIHGSITAPANLPSDLTIWVGNASSAEVAQISLPADTFSIKTTTDKVRSGTNVYFNLGMSTTKNSEAYYALWPDGESYRSQDYFFETSEGQKNRIWMTLADWDDASMGAPEPAGGWYDYTFNLKIVAKGGGEEETPKATLVGRVDPGCLQGVTVAISGNDYSASTTTKEMDYDTYYTKLNCMYGYKFENLALGTYTLTYSKEGYNTQTQEVTITEAGEKVAPPVTLEAKPVEYIFEGYIKYTDGDNNEVKVEGAKITAYDGPGEGASVVGTPVYTDKKGYWSMTMECAKYTTYYFFAEHDNIVVNSRAEGSAMDESGNMVTIYCDEKQPDLYGMKTCKVKQSGTVDEPRVQISWTWPEGLIEDYKTESGEGVYQISKIVVHRQPFAGGNISTAAEITPAAYASPSTFTSVTDTSDLLHIGSKYKYSIEIQYSKPLGTFSIPNDENLTIELLSSLAQPDSVMLTLTVNDEQMGTVSGAGKYEKGDPVVIKATPNRGYLFEGWYENDAKVFSEAEKTFNLNQNRELKATFVERPPIKDSVTLTLVYDATMGTVEGAGRYAKGEEVTITATPKAGYAFKQWKAGTVILSSKKSYTFIANTDSTITAVFERKITYRAMINCRARQIDAQSVRLDWAWPQELVDEYKTAEGGIYQISTINITRKYATQQTPDNIGTIRPQEFQLPVTYFVDNSEEYPLIVDTTYIYFLEVNYEEPAFKTVTVNNDGTDPNLSVKVAESVAPVQYYTLTLGVNGEEKGTASASPASNQYMDGDQITVTATPKTGYLFQCWKEGETEISTKNPHTFKITRNMALTAVFVAEPEAQKVTLTLGVNDAEMGTVRGANIGANEYVEGAMVTLTAVPNEGYVFKVWKEGEQEVHDQAVYTFTLSQNRTLTAVFDVKPTVETEINIVLSVNDTLMGTVTGEGKYPKGTQVTVTATPKTGYLFKGWKEDNQMLNAGATYVFMAQKDRSLEAVFAAEPVEPVKDSFELTLRCDAAMGTVEGAGKYEEGTPVDIKATANEGFVFVAWMSGNDTVAKTAEHKITLVSDSTLTAVFAKDEEPVDPSANEDVEQAAWSVYAQDGQIVLRSNTACQYDVYNMAGVLVKCAKAHANEYRIAVNNSGLYIVRRISATGVSVKKVMVR